MKNQCWRGVWGLVLVAGLSTLALADDRKGTITEWDGAKRTVTIEDAAGKSFTFLWDSKTKVHGSALRGERVTVSYANDPDGKPRAAVITVEAKPPAAKPKSSK